MAAIYPNINGIPQLKTETARFVKAFMDIEVSQESCVPVTGSMQSTYASFLTSGQCYPDKQTILFIDLGLPVQKQQITVMGYACKSFDVYAYRGGKLRAKLESYLQSGQIAALTYSNPNNPGWFCLQEE